MNWNEISRDSHGGIVYATYRCGWCRKWAVVPFGNKPGKCCCVATAKGKR